MPSYALDDPDPPSDIDLSLDDELTQACFVLHAGRPKSGFIGAGLLDQSATKAAKGTRRQQSECQKLPTMPPCLTGEPPECGVWRAEAFQTIWARLEKAIQEVLQLKNQGSFQDIRKFICDSQFSDAQLKLYLSAKANDMSLEKDIIGGNSAVVGMQLHTALVFLRNVDSSDHKETFKELAVHLKQHDFHVASLLPHNFSSKAGIGGPLNSLLKQTVGINPDTTDMDILVTWHREPHNQKYPLVIIVEDAEHCSTTVLADFITILSEWIAELPIVLILGMATSGDSLRKLLPSSAIRCLHIQKFMLQSPDDYLESIINAVLVEPFNAFELGCDVTRFLLKFFKDHDATITSFLRAVKMACMDHFYSQPLSFLCKKLLQPLEQGEFEDFCKTLPGVLLTYASTLSSFQRHYGSEVDIGKIMAMSLIKFREQRQHWSIVFQCFLVAGKHVGVDCIELVKEMLQSPSSKDKPDELKPRVTTMAAGDKGLKVYNGIMSKLKETSISTLATMLQQWEKLTPNLEELRIEIQNLLKFTSEVQWQASSESLHSSGCNGLRRKQLLSSRHEFVEEPKTVINKVSSDVQVHEEEPVGLRDCQPDQDSIITSKNHSKLHKMIPKDNLILYKVDSKAVNMRIVNLLEKMLSEYFVPVESLPFHEILCFKDVSTIKQAMIGETRARIQKDLLNIHASLRCTCCKPENSIISASMHDSCLLYNLAHEQGDHVNVYDWYQSFATSLCHPELQHPRQKPQGRSNMNKRIKKEFPQVDRAVIQARFSKAASELQLVGLVRLTSKKRSDFVQLTLI